MKFVLMMKSGEPLNDKIREVLTLNAIDMWESKSPSQRIKSRTYDGVIRSTLEVVQFDGSPYVAFESVLGSDMWEVNEVNFLISIEDLEEVHNMISSLSESHKNVCPCDDCQQKRSECGCDDCVAEYLATQSIRKFLFKE